jgi:hypothetical protein
MIKSCVALALRFVALIINWIGRRYRKWLRRLDADILWTICKERAIDLDHAKSAFYFHIVNDPAWTRDFSEAELHDYIEALR